MRFYVWFDKNRDGIQDADEPGVPGVIVTLRDGNGNVIGTTVTDGDGKYLFTNVPAGTGYTVTFDANLPYLGPSISSPHFTIQDASNTGGNKSIVPNTGAYNGLTATTPPFNVTAGSHTRLLDAGISSAFPLPVEMIELDILWVGDYSKVIWKTATEINNSHFEVERSLDGVNFVKVGEVNSKAINGNSNTILSYDFMEDLASYSNHIFYYRVIQVDYDGASETSRILVLVRKEPMFSEMKMMIFDFKENTSKQIGETIIPPKHIWELGGEFKVWEDKNGTLFYCSRFSNVSRNNILYGR